MPGPPPICAAIRAAVLASGMTQKAIASQMGEKQQTISGWMGSREPRLNDIVKLERSLGLTRGYLLRAGGYVDELQSTADCIRADPDLLPPHRELVLATYESARSLGSRSKRMRITSRTKPNKSSNI